MLQQTTALLQGEVADEQNDGGQTGRAPPRRVSRPYRRWSASRTSAVSFGSVLWCGKTRLTDSTLNFHRPFRPRQPADQAGDDQPQEVGAEEKQQGEEKQTEDSNVPQTNGDVATGQRPQRSVRRRRQRNSESSTSKVSPSRRVYL